jgi:hypothetical protein
MTSADQRQPVVVEIVIATLDLDSRHMRSEQTPAEALQSYTYSTLQIDFLLTSGAR